MKTLKHLIFLPLLFMVGCAMGPSYYANPVPITPKTVMADKACGSLPVDHNPNVNLTSGWSSKPPEGMTAMSCPGKYASGPFYCASVASCPTTLVWSTSTPVGMKSTDIHLVLDLLSGTIKACGENVNKFGVGSLNCKRETYTATVDKPLRIIVPVQSVGQAQPESPIALNVEALSDKIVIGQIGTAEVLN